MHEMVLRASGCADSLYSFTPLPPSLLSSLPPPFLSPLLPPPTHPTLPPSLTVVHVVAHWYNYERFAALYNLTGTSVERFAPLDSQPIPANITSPIAAIRLCFATCKTCTDTHTHTYTPLLAADVYLT